MSEAPEPMTALAHDVSGLDGFMLNTEKLMASELWALATGDEFKAAMGLWCRAWKQSPAGSLPNDERVLAGFSGAGANWPAVRDIALRGFVLCSDGRLYHKELCKDVLRAAIAKKQRNDRTKAATEARNGKRDGQRNDERDVEYETNVTDSHRRDLNGKEVEEDKKGEAPPKHDLDAAVSAWNAMASSQSLSIVHRLTDTRRRSLNARLNECGGMDGWTIALDKIAASAFLKGNNDRSWHADFDFLLQQKSFTKLMEGGYDGKNKSPIKPNTLAPGFDAIDAAIAELKSREIGERLNGGEADFEDVPRLRKVSA